MYEKATNNKQTTNKQTTNKKCLIKLQLQQHSPAMFLEKMDGPQQI